MKNKKISAIVTTVVFLIIIFALSVINILTPQKTFSENENRYLAKFPEFSWSALLDGSFAQKVESAITDQFVGRDFWVSVKNESEYILQKNESKGVYFADDNYLIEKFDSVDYENYLKNLDYVKRFSEAMKAYNVDVKTMLIPTASSVLSDKLMQHTPEIDQQMLLDEAKKILSEEDFIDVRDELAKYSDEYIYYKTDHHWTTLGAFYAYNYFLMQNGMPTHEIAEFEQEILSEEFLGTTQSKANLLSTTPDTMTAFMLKDAKFTVEYNSDGKIYDTLFAKQHLSKKDKYPVFLNGNQALTKITSENKNGKKLLLVKDSYGNTFSTLLANDYEEVYIVDLRFFKMDIQQLVEENGINEALVLYNLKGFSEDYSLYTIAK